MKSHRRPWVQGLSIWVLILSPAAVKADPPHAGEVYQPPSFRSATPIATRVLSGFSNGLTRGQDVLEVMATALAGPAALPLEGVTNQLAVQSAARAHSSAIHYLEQGEQFCGQILDESVRLGRIGSPTARAARDLARCCQWQLGDCYAQCQVPSDGRGHSFLVGAVSNLPFGAAFLDTVTDHGSAATRLRSAAIACVRCVERGITDVRSATIDGWRVIHCGGWR